jgi:hypothetical protein
MSQEQQEWQIDDAYASLGKFSKFAKKHPREYESLFANLDKVFKVLSSGHKLNTFKFGFFRSEGEGVYRIGQTAVRSSQESRLYIFPDETSKTIYMLGIGGKNGQSEDIQQAKELRRSINKSAEIKDAETKQ